MKYRMMIVAVGSMLASTAMAEDTAVVPNGFEATQGNASFVFISSTPRTVQFLIHEDQLTALEGRELNSISWRLPASATSAWPSVDTSMTNFDVRLGPSVAPEDRELDFDANRAGPQTLVRTGPLSIPAESYPFGESPNDFGLRIEFDAPWLYSGGHLLVEIQHTGHTTTGRAMDALSTSSTGYLSQFATAWQGTGGVLQGNFPVMQLTAADEDTCPGDLTGDGNVGVPDLLALLACWGPVDSGCADADLTGDDNVGVPDLLALLGNWGPCQ